MGVGGPPSDRTGSAGQGAEHEEVNIEGQGEGEGEEEEANERFLILSEVFHFFC